MTTFSFGSDLHGNEQHSQAVACFKRFVEAEKPDLRIFGGDLFNMAALRRAADHNEKELRLGEDLDEGLALLEWYKPNVLILGNHDARLWDAIQRDRVQRRGWLAELAGVYISKFNKTVTKLGIKVLPYEKTKGIYKFESLSFGHGFGGGKDLTKDMAETYGNIVLGHGHRVEQIPVVRLGKPAIGYQAGCLCVDDMDWTRADLGALKQEQGFAYGVIDGKNHHVSLARIVDGKAVVASDFKVI